MDRKEKIQLIARRYYKQKNIAKVLVEQTRNREVVAKFYDKFGKRPDALEYEHDVIALANQGATSFHVSEEIWKDVMQLSTGLSLKQLNELRIGWDLLIDIDCKFLEYSKITAHLVVEALKFHGIHSYGIKYSGNKGFHIVVSFDAFPKQVRNIQTKDFFPEGARLIASYLKELIAKQLSNAILSINTLKEIAERTNKKPQDLMISNSFNPFSVVDIDTVLISSRHLYRAAYSLHEKTGLVSVVLDEDKLKKFVPSMAKPDEIVVKPFIKPAEKNEAKELLLQALDWQTRNKFIVELPKQIKTSKAIKIDKLTPAVMPPCIKKLLEGIKQDGRKRALFVLITYLRTLNQDFDVIENIVREWNEKNYKPLTNSYIKCQLNWFKKQTKTILPPNCDNRNYYADIGICDATTRQTCNVKNPINYTIKLARLKPKQKKQVKKKKTKHETTA